MLQWFVQYWLEILFGVLMGCLSASVAKIRKVICKKQEEQDALKVGLIAILHDRLFGICKQYLSLGYIPSDDAEEILDNAETIYNAYHSLGGNGTGTKVYNKFCSLKIKENMQESQ